MTKHERSVHQDATLNVRWAVLADDFNNRLVKEHGVVKMPEIVQSPCEILEDISDHARRRWIVVVEIRQELYETFTVRSRRSIHQLFATRETDQFLRRHALSYNGADGRNQPCGRFHSWPFQVELVCSILSA